MRTIKNKLILRDKHNQNELKFHSYSTISNKFAYMHSHLKLLSNKFRFTEYKQLLLSDGFIRQSMVEVPSYTVVTPKGNMAFVQDEFPRYMNYIEKMRTGKMYVKRIVY